MTVPMPFTDARPAHRRSPGHLTALCVTVCAAFAAAGCGSPPQPPPSSPPRASTALDGSFAPGASGAPAYPVPSGGPSGAGVSPTYQQPGAQPGYQQPGYQPGTQPGYPNPGYQQPGYPLPTYPTYPPAPTATATVTRPPTTSPPPHAPRCRSGPSNEQVLAKVRSRPGVPVGAQLKVTDGPYCASGWQYSAVGLVTDPRAEPLQVVTRGRPAALELIEAGGDVCSDRVQADAPVGIRVLACGA